MRGLFISLWGKDKGNSVFKVYPKTEITHLQES